MKNVFDRTTMILLGLCLLTMAGCLFMLEATASDVRFCTQAELMDGTKLPEECEDLGFSDEAQPDQCQRKVAITEPVDIKSVCWEETTKILNPQGLMRYMLIRPGCVALAMSQFRHNIEVYQDKDCWILLYDGTGKNQRWKIEKEEVTKNLKGA